MKNLSYSLFLSLIFISCNPTTNNITQTSSNPAQDKKEIQQLIQDSFDDIFSALDTSKVTKHYTQDFILLENGELWDKKSVMEYQLDAATIVPAPKRVNKFDFIKTEVEGDKGWVAYHNYASISLGQEVKRELYWLESAVAIRKEGRWKLQMLHSTYVPKKE